MTNELEKRAKEYAEAMAGKRPEIDSEVAFPISFLGLWLRDVRWLEEGYIAGAKAERERILKASREVKLGISFNGLAYMDDINRYINKLERIVKGEE